MPLHFRGRRGDIHPLGCRYRLNRIRHGRDVGPESESIVWAFVLGKRNDAAGGRGGGGRTFRKRPRAWYHRRIDAMVVVVRRPRYCRIRQSSKR